MVTIVERLKRSELLIDEIVESILGFAFPADKWEQALKVLPHFADLLHCAFLSQFFLDVHKK